MQPIIVLIFIALFIAILVLSYMANKKHREAIKAVAVRLGLNFSPEKSRTIARRYEYINRIRNGRDRYAYNILEGTYRGYPVQAFDYHYKTGSGKNTHHYYFSFYIHHLPISVPELKIGPEGFFSKIAQAIGYDDIDFESHEFSSKFCVRSGSKKFAYDICHSQMIEYLLANPDLTIEMERSTLAISFSGRMKPEKIEYNLKRLTDIRTLIPEYVLNRS